jgi:hypothetical protein
VVVVPTLRFEFTVLVTVFEQRGNNGGPLLLLHLLALRAFIEGIEAL